MADTDSDSEIQFNVRHDADEGGHGDMIQLSPVPRLNLDEPEDDVARRESPVPTPTPVYVPAPHAIRDQRVRSRSNEVFGSSHSNRSPDRRHDAGDHVRQRSPEARSFYPQHYPEPRPAAQYHRMHVKPEFFKGEDDWDQYISHFQNCADLGRWSETDKALTLSACLKGQARAFYLGLSPQDRCSYYRLVQKFSERFGSVRQQSRYLTKFETRKRGPAETIASLGDDLRLLAQRAYPDLGTDAQESLALHQFYKAITLEMKCRCIDRDCRTIDSAVQIVERYEAILGEGTETKKNTVRAINDATDSGPSGSRRSQQYWYNNDVILKQILDRLEKIEGHPQSNGATDGPRPKRNYQRGACYICQSHGHFLKDCPIYKQCQDEMQASNGQDGSRLKRKTRRNACFICQSLEHFLQDCPIYKQCQDVMQASNGQVSGNENPSAL